MPVPILITPMLPPAIAAVTLPEYAVLELLAPKARETALLLVLVSETAEEPDRPPKVYVAELVLPKASVPAPPANVLPCRAFELLSRSVPPSTVVLPVNELDAERVSWPVPDFARPPVPPILPPENV